MAQVSLKSYCDEVRNLIKDGAYDKALVTGRYILQHYPKYVEAYGLLAEACLGKGQYDEASDLFARVLSVDPENISARLGMSKLFEAKGDLASAVLQMREAFDLAPSQTAIRSELNRLLKLQGGEPTRLKLTRQGLGRIYLRGGLYTQAADEFETLLRENPDQVDVEVSLAEALWRDGQMIRSVEVCQSALNKLPYCLKANLILAETWMRSDREDEGETHLQRVRTVDPEGELVTQLVGESTLIPRVSVMLTRMGDAQAPAPAPEAVDEEEVPAWLKEAGPQQTGTTEDLSLPAAAAIVRTATAPAEVAWTPANEAEALEAADLPDWLKKVRADELAAASPEIAPAPAAEAAPEIASEVEPATEVELPPWLAEAAPPEVKAAETAAEAPEAAPAEETPSRLSTTGEEEIEESIAAEEPEWLQTLKAERGIVGLRSQIDTPASTPEPEDERPGWLRQAAEEEAEAEAPSESVSAVDATEETPQPAEIEAEEEPDWRRILREEGLEGELPSCEQLAAAQAEPEGETGDLGDLTDVLDETQIPDWLRDAWSKEGGELAPATEAPSLEAEPDAAVSAEPEPAVPTEAALTEDEAVFAEWLREASEAAAADEAQLPEAAGEEASATPDEEEFPAWLRDIAVGAPTGEASLSEATAAAPEGAALAPVEEEEEIPDWLRDAPAAVTTGEERAVELPTEAIGASATAAPTDREEIPDWLRLLREEGLESELPSEEDLAAAGLLEEQAPVPTGEVQKSRPPSREELIAAGLLEEPIAKAPSEELPADVAESPAAPSGPEPSWPRAMLDSQEGLISEAHLQQAGLVQEQGEPEAAGAIAESADMPDWLRQAALDEGLVQPAAEAPITEEASVATETTSGVIEPPVPELPAAPTIPTPTLDWLDALRADDVAEAILPEGPAETSAVEAAAVEKVPPATSQDAEAIPDWMRMLRSMPGETEPEPHAVAAESQIEAQATEPAPLTADRAQEPVEGRAGVAATGEVRAMAQPPQDIAPDWFAALRREATAGEEAEPVAEADVQAETAAVAEPPVAKIDEAVLAGYETAVKKNPKDYLTRWKLSQAYAGAGDHEAAITHSQALVEADEMVPQVTEYLKSAISSGIQTRQAYQVLGDACFKSGRLEEAVDAYRKALSLLY